MPRSNWIVSINTEDADPLIFGPYSQARAEELADKMNAFLELKSDELGWARASAYPIRNIGIRDMKKEFGG